MKTIFSLLIGIAIGAASWASSSIFGTFEPFDSSRRFIVSQLVLAFGAAYFGYKRRLTDLFSSLIGMYVGLNAYSYVLGSSEAKAWFLLGLVTTIALLVFPLVVGLGGHFVRKKINTSMNDH